MRPRAFAITTFTFILIILLSPLALAAAIEVDLTSNVSTVIDGSSFALSTGEKVKLAGIITPSLGENGYEASKSYLSNLVHQGSTVYLDIDTQTATDQGTLLCIAYIDYNATHYENVNKAMIQNGYAIPSTANSTIFKPSSWTWFVPKQTPTASPTDAPTQVPTATPTATPFNAPSPSVSPDLSEPTVTGTQSPPLFGEQTNSVLIVILAAIILVCIVSVAAVVKLIKRK